MTGQAQRAALQRKIWDIANDVRGSVDGWDFKQYVLGVWSRVLMGWIDDESFWL
jgi:type I restriction-modification system DNA methylase subunit